MPTLLQLNHTPNPARPIVALFSRPFFVSRRSSSRNASYSSGGGLHRIGEDVSERLDVIQAQFRVIVTRRTRDLWIFRQDRETDGIEFEVGIRGRPAVER